MGICEVGVCYFCVGTCMYPHAGNNMNADVREKFDEVGSLFCGAEDQIHVIRL